jgi:hypothetical protein
MKSFKEFLEEDMSAAPTNSVGSGSIAGVGVPNAVLPNQAEPGIKLPRKKKSPVLFKTTRKGYYG